MGYFRHHAIIVCADDFGKGHMKEAHEKAVELLTFNSLHGSGMLVTPVVRGTANGYETFAVVPDGSKEGWGASGEAEAKREAFIAWLEANEMRLWSLNWVQVEFGGDGGPARIVSDPKGEQA